MKTIYVSEYEEDRNKGWTTKGFEGGEEYDMFEKCESLVGGNGTTYNSSNTNTTYARIDKEGEPGYFTDIKDKK